MIYNISLTAVKTEFVYLRLSLELEKLHKSNDYIVICNRMMLWSSILEGIPSEFQTMPGKRDKVKTHCQIIYFIHPFEKRDILHVCYRIV